MQRAPLDSEVLPTALLLIAVLVGARIVQIIHRGFTGSISRVPGPLLNRFTNWPLRLASINGRRIHYVHALHQRYGPAVRVSPTEVSIGDSASVKEIHRHGSGFLKTQWYATFAQEGHIEENKGIFAVISPRLHSTRRRLLARGFAKSSITEWEPIVQEKVQMALEGVARNAKETGTADILAWFTFMANDVMATLAFGQSFKALEAGEKTPYMRAVETTMMLYGISAELSWLAPFLRLFVPIKFLDGVGLKAIRESQRREKNGEQTPNIFSKMMAAEGDTLTEKQIAKEASNLLLAGSDTTAVSITYLLWAVLSHGGAIKDRLQQEADSLAEGFTAQEAEDLPYLSQVVQESLRLYGAAPGCLPRSVPVPGAFLGGHALDAGTIVSTQSYTTHRDPTIFKDSLRFDPERWAHPSKEMEDTMMPFGAGARVCLGIHLARAEMSLTVVHFLRRFGRSARLAPETTPASMDLENYFLIAPRSHQCRIQL